MHGTVIIGGREFATWRGDDGTVYLSAASVLQGLPNVRAAHAVARREFKQGADYFSAAELKVIGGQNRGQPSACAHWVTLWTAGRMLELYGEVSSDRRVLAGVKKLVNRCIRLDARSLPSQQMTPRPLERSAARTPASAPPKLYVFVLHGELAHTNSHQCVDSPCMCLSVSESTSETPSSKRARRALPTTSSSAAADDDNNASPRYSNVVVSALLLIARILHYFSRAEAPPRALRAATTPTTPQWWRRRTTPCKAARCRRRRPLHLHRYPEEVSI